QDMDPPTAYLALERGQLFARRGELDKAVADFDKAFARIKPADPLSWYQCALLRLERGDAAGYARLLADMQAHFAQTRSVDASIFLVRACTLPSKTVGDTARLLQLAKQIEKARPKDTAFLATSGLAHYRGGEYEQAIARCRRTDG